ncbi:hypothetical protein GT370_07480 [Acidocella sp. MX-AZ03]|nr:hypothetical protein [Acidocella sp. MX-AZ03]WBO60603.1 hypothetical protein GT370_07480 [Acidocella sp. MX-AZ03]
MAGFFLGGAAGSAACGVLLAQGGWIGLCIAGGALGLVGLGYFLSVRRR